LANCVEEVVAGRIVGSGSGTLPKVCEAALETATASERALILYFEATAWQELYRIRSGGP